MRKLKVGNNLVNVNDIMETIQMIQEENLDIRTITMGISLLDCCDADIKKSCEKIYDKVCRKAEHLVKTGEEIELKYGIPIVNKRISVTPVAIPLAVSGGNPLEYALTLEKCAGACGVNFIGGYSALVQKGFSAGDKELIESIPEALTVTDHLCSSVNVGSTRAGINMDAVGMMGRIVKRSAELTAGRDCIGAAKLVVFCNAVEDNPFMAGAFHGVGEPDCEINVGVSGPGVVRAALAKLQRELLDVNCRYVKPGGTLIYSTCTLSKQENQDNALWFLQTHPEFGPLPLPEELGELGLLEGHMLTVFPHKGDGDGFFMARMQKKA